MCVKLAPLQHCCCCFKNSNARFPRCRPRHGCWLIRTFQTPTCDGSLRLSISARLPPNMFKRANSCCLGPLPPHSFARVRSSNFSTLNSFQQRLSNLKPQCKTPNKGRECLAVTAGLQSTSILRLCMRNRTRSARRLGLFRAAFSTRRLASYVGGALRMCCVSLFCQRLKAYASLLNVAFDRRGCPTTVAGFSSRRTKLYRSILPMDNPFQLNVFNAKTMGASVPYFNAFAAQITFFFIFFLALAT